MYLLSGFGVTIGAHRYFTHGTFVARPWLRHLLVWMFLASAQGSLLRWVRDHQIHHRYSDLDGDPHSPQHETGFWYAQLTWLWKTPPSRAENKRLYEQYVAQLGADGFLRASSRPSLLVGLHLVVIAFLYVVGAVWESGWAMDALVRGWQMGLSCVVWGAFLRIICVLHATSLVNSAAHLWGYRNYKTPEHSRNNWWVAIVSLGEGWHNNHHGRPAAANQGFHRWWELDLSFCVLLLLGAVGALQDLRVYRAHSGKTELWFRRPISTLDSL
jgi:fatty-acid desaturase